MKKKLIFTLALVVLALIGCQQKSYKISGEASEEFDSVQVFLTERINREWQNLDSAYIINGKFEFIGDVDSVRIVNLYFERVPMLRKALLNPLYLKTVPLK